MTISRARKKKSEVSESSANLSIYVCSKNYDNDECYEINHRAAPNKTIHCQVEDIFSGR